MPLDMQTKLLRVLQEGIITRIGSAKPIPLDVEVIASTNKDFEEGSYSFGRFRKDLFYRLNVLPIFLPALSQRKGDILLLTDYFMKKIAEKLGKKEVKIPKGYIKSMMEYDWPGNVRELENFIELIIYSESIPYDYFNQEKSFAEELYDNYIQGSDMNLCNMEKAHLKKVLKKQWKIYPFRRILRHNRNTLVQ